MQQRRSSTGRPSGTDGSDFSYRMTVDSRYQKVAQGRSQLQILITIQGLSTWFVLLMMITLNNTRFLNFRELIYTMEMGFVPLTAVIQLIRAVCLVLSISKGNVPSPLAMSNLTTAFLSIIVGELGRRRSQLNFLRFYIVAAAAVILLSIACLAKGNLKLEDILNTHVDVKKFEFLEAASVLLGLLVQVFAVKTTLSLISNMSPPKRTSQVRDVNLLSILA